MSFKRDSNDPSYLNILRQRRVRDLLAEDIPDDEASLLSNGRFACVICHNKPVFDTVNMLMVHRKGKKHEMSAVKHRLEKEELRELIKQRRQEQLEKTGSSQIKISSFHTKTLFNSVPYDARVKKKLKPYDRKPKLNISSETESTSSSCLPGNRSADVINMQSEGPIRHHRQLKKIFETSETEFEPRPYQGNSKSMCVETKDSSSGSQGMMKEKRQLTGENRVMSDISEDSPSPRKSLYSTEANEKDPNGQPERKELAQKYWQMAGSGWKKDWDGKWIRDEECEFDSDEEPPDLP